MNELKEYIHKLKSDSTYEIAVVGSNVPRPLKNMVGKVFGDNDVSVQEKSIEGIEEELVLFKDGEIVATSPLQEVSDSLLLVNTDLYTTGSIELADITTPDVIKCLEGERFVLRGYPESNYEKLMLVLISRHIEKLSYTNPRSTHRASFQQLSRIKDEKRTYEIYQALNDIDSDTHIYGIPDWTPPEDWDITVHKDTERSYINYWFVVHRSSIEEMALLAVQEDTNLWEAMWTTDPTQVREIEEHIIENFDDSDTK